MSWVSAHSWGTGVPGGAPFGFTLSACKCPPIHAGHPQVTSGPSVESPRHSCSWAGLRVVPGGWLALSSLPLGLWGDATTRGMGGLSHRVWQGLGRCTHLPPGSDHQSGRGRWLRPQSRKAQHSSATRPQPTGAAQAISAPWRPTWLYSQRPLLAVLSNATLRAGSSSVCVQPCGQEGSVPREEQGHSAGPCWEGHKPQRSLCVPGVWGLELSSEQELPVCCARPGRPNPTLPLPPGLGCPSLRVQDAMPSALPPVSSDLQRVSVTGPVVLPRISSQNIFKLASLVGIAPSTVLPPAQ